MDDTCSSQQILSGGEFSKDYKQRTSGRGVLAVVVCGLILYAATVPARAAGAVKVARHLMQLFGGGS